VFSTSQTAVALGIKIGAITSTSSASRGAIRGQAAKTKLDLVFGGACPSGAIEATCEEQRNVALR
jgi:hypothetical protein